MKSDIFKDDLYIIPIIQNILPEFNELNITFIVFEDINGDIRIKVPLDKFKNYETKNYIFLYKIRENYEPIYFRTKAGYNPLIQYNNKNKYLDNVINSIREHLQIFKREDLFISTFEEMNHILKSLKYNVNRVFIYNNKMTHLITEDNYIISIKPCFIKDCKLSSIYDIEKIELNNYKNTLKFIKKISKKTNKYLIDRLIVDNTHIVNIIFSNQSYIPITKTKGKKYDYEGFICSMIKSWGLQNLNYEIVIFNDNLK